MNVNNIFRKNSHLFFRINQQHGSNKGSDSAKRRPGSNKFQESFLQFTESATTNDIGKQIEPYLFNPFLKIKK